MVRVENNPQEQGGRRSHTGAREQGLGSGSLAPAWVLRRPVRHAQGSPAEPGSPPPTPQARPMGDNPHPGSHKEPARGGDTPARDARATRAQPRHIHFQTRGPRRSWPRAGAEPPPQNLPAQWRPRQLQGLHTEQNTARLELGQHVGEPDSLAKRPHPPPAEQAAGTLPPPPPSLGIPAKAKGSQAPLCLQAHTCARGRGARSAGR